MKWRLLPESEMFLAAVYDDRNITVRFVGTQAEAEAVLAALESLEAK